MYIPFISRCIYNGSGVITKSGYIHSVEKGLLWEHPWPLGHFSLDVISCGIEHAQTEQIEPGSAVLFALEQLERHTTI
jgi:hypothetical protein